VQAERSRRLTCPTHLDGLGETFSPRFKLSTNRTSDSSRHGCLLNVVRKFWCRRARPRSWRMHAQRDSRSWISTARTLRIWRAIAGASSRWPKLDFSRVDTYGIPYAYSLLLTREPKNVSAAALFSDEFLAACAITCMMACICVELVPAFDRQKVRWSFSLDRANMNSNAKLPPSTQVRMIILPQYLETGTDCT